MNIELKSISVQETLSEETYCYSASLYVEGRKIGTVSNLGHGGCDDFHGDQAAYDRADAWLRENRTIDLGHGLGVVSMDMETLCAGLVGDHLTRADMRKALRSTIIWRDAEGLMQMAFKGCRKIEARHLARFAVKYPATIPLNIMPEADALAIWKEAAA